MVGGGSLVIQTRKSLVRVSSTAHVTSCFHVTMWQHSVFSGACSVQSSGICLQNQYFRPGMISRKIALGEQQQQERRLRLLAGHLKMEGPTEISSSKMFEGFNKRYKHYSSTLGCHMTFSIFFPPAAASEKVPVLYWLSGLTCTDENFIIKSGAQRAASKESVALIAPDTSPSAGFYLNANQEKWKNWRMYDYIVDELPKLLSANFHQLDTSHASIFGHSMGGHGALTIFLKNPDKYKSVSAFAPIANPIDCPWGQKAFSNYLGSDKSSWEGDEDKFLHDQLLPHKFEEACKSVNVPLTLRLQRGYDHSFCFISTFVDEHIQYHSKAVHEL